jgi:aminoglycoside phosphotransferase (APT) family kinase protein
MTTDPAVSDRAARVVSGRWPGAELLSLESLTGHSGLTLRGVLKGSDCPEQVVLKLCPPGRDPIGRHDVVRQGALLQDLAASSDVPVPQVLATDTDGSPVVILSWEPGEAAEPVLDMAVGDQPPEVLVRRFIDAAQTLARLHQVDPEVLPTTRGLRPAAPADELARWQPTMATVEPELRAGAEHLFARLADRAPSALGPCIVHGDYRLGNILCDDERVRAVIDWEIWSIGDPRADLGWFRVMSCPWDLSGIATEMAGVVPADDLLAAYQTTTGSPVDQMAWFDAATRYKMAAIMGNNLRRHRTGRRDDPYQERLVTVIPALIASGTEMAKALD